MPSYEIYIDSRDRISGSASDATFQLNHTLTNVRSVYCKSFVFYNIFENITNSTNYFQIITLNEPTDIRIPTGVQYDAQRIVTTLNQLMAPYGSVSLSGNQLSWNTRYAIKNINTTTLGLAPGAYVTPNVPTILSLASLAYVSLSSPSIQPAHRPISASSSGLNSAPLITTPIQTEFGFIQTDVQYFPDPIYCNNHALQNISFQVTDPYSKRPLDTTWSVVLCFSAD